MTDEFYDVIVVGAGAAGIGMGVALHDAGLENMLIVDRQGVGASFERWPKETTSLTPSFPTNSVGMLDLNSIAIGTSPAWSLSSEHPDGKAYARYLQGVADYFELPVRPDVDVLSVHPDQGGFVLETSCGRLYAEYIVWAAGEFQYPNLHPFPGAELCLHSSRITTYRSVDDEELVVIGGYESGIDSAIQLAGLMKQVTVLARESPWESRTSDPSVALSIYTRERLQTVLKLGGVIELVGDADVVRVMSVDRGFEVQCRDGRSWHSPGPPVLATGFVGSHRLLHGQFEERPDGYPLLSHEDESTVTPGLFFAGPLVRHDQHIFCFIYKFRQRFAVVARAIATRCGLKAEDLELYRQWGMYLDDLSCCGEECVC